MNNTIDHTESDFINEDQLKPECVKVRLTRVDVNFGTQFKYCFDVEISILDSDFTFADDVASALRHAGFEVITRARKSGFIVKKEKFRTMKNFKRVCDL